MAESIIAQGTKLEMATTATTPVTTMTATVGYPTILTKEDHGLKNGDIGTLSAFAGADAALMNGKVVIVKYVTDDTFAVDIDTTGKTLTPGYGTITPVTWQEIGEVTDWDGPSGTAAVIDMTHLRSTEKAKRMGIEDEGQFTFSVNFMPEDLGQLAIIAARKSGLEKDFRVTYEDDSVQEFSGFVLGFSTSGAVDGKVPGKVTIEITGAVELNP